MAGMSELHASLIDVAVRTARQASALVRDRRAELMGTGELAATAETKSSAVDPVTVVDKESEDLIISTLLGMRPDDGVLGEEGANIESQSGVTWIVDPIDGTVNFLYGIPQYAVSMAAADGDEIVAGVVVNVASNRMYTACRGHGAFVHESPDSAAKRLTGSGAARMSEALVATGFSYTPQWRAQQAQLLCAILPEVRDIRRAGSAALDLCMLAEGRIDAYYEHGTHPWDYAAGALIAAEAGARVIHPGLSASGHDGGLTAAAAPEIWDDFRALLARAGAEKPLH